jgi:uncharacterized protein YceH (UPF0502 family)
MELVNDDAGIIVNVGRIVGQLVEKNAICLEDKPVSLKCVVVPANVISDLMKLIKQN